MARQRELPPVDWLQYYFRETKSVSPPSAWDDATILSWMDSLSTSDWAKIKTAWRSSAQRFRTRAARSRQRIENSARADAVMEEVFQGVAAEAKAIAEGDWEAWLSSHYVPDLLKQSLSQLQTLMPSADVYTAIDVAARYLLLNEGHHHAP